MFDLTPILQIMAIGLVLASGPLLWLWLRHRNTTVAQRLSGLTLLILFLTFDLIIFGAFTRLTNSGLGCPDWPGCYGSFSPFGAKLHIDNAQALLPTGPVTHVKAWIEMLHRYLATTVGALILVLTAISWYFWRRGAGQKGTAMLNPWWPTATLVWVCAQGLFGALTVTMKLFPAIVTLHLLGGIGLLVLLIIQANAYLSNEPEYISRKLRWFLWLVTIFLGVQIALGAWVSTNYAVLACNTFPRCQGSWWPDMDFANAFTLWRPLGFDAQGSLLGFSALTAIHYVHRLFAYLVFVLLLSLVLGLRRANSLLWQRHALLALLILQFISGLSNVVLDWPLIAALTHTACAAALMGMLCFCLCSSKVHKGNLV